MITVVLQESEKDRANFKNTLPFLLGLGLRFRLG